MRARSLIVLSLIAAAIGVALGHYTSAVSPRFEAGKFNELARDVAQLREDIDRFSFVAGDDERALHQLGAAERRLKIIEARLSAAGPMAAQSSGVWRAVVGAGNSIPDSVRASIAIALATDQRNFDALNRTCRACFAFARHGARSFIVAAGEADRCAAGN